MSEPKARILVVEDDESILLGLEMNLSAEGFAVETELDGVTGLARALENPPDLLILDVMLPHENGFEVLRKLRESGATFPVIMLSARSAEVEKVMGLELGAEDYITKPFGVRELVARVRAALRREQRAKKDPETPQAQILAGRLVIDPLARTVTRGGDLVNLTATEFDVLYCLVQATGQVLSREEIQTRVWGPGHHGTLRTIDNFLLQLRSKLEEDPTAPAHLLTVRGVGYRFVR